MLSNRALPEERKLVTVAPLALICSAIVWLSITSSAGRPFWFDELYTFHLARLPDFNSLIAALSKGVDLQPPLFFLTTAAAQKLFGSSEVATRLPALAGYLLMTVCIYLFVLRRTNVLYATVAALFPTVTEAFHYSYEARPYGLMLGFSAMALVCWQQAAVASGVRRRIGLAGLWLSLALAISLHYYCVLVFVAIAIGEAIRLYQNRRLDIPVALAGGLAALVGVIYIPLIRGATAIHSDHPWNAVSLRFIMDAWQTALMPAAVPMALCLIVLALLWGPAEKRGLTLPETGACLGLVLLPVFAYLLGRFVTHMMTERYVLPLIAGFAVFAAVGFYRGTGGRSAAALALIAILGGIFVVRHMARVRLTNEYATVTLPAGHTDLPLVAAGAIDFPPLFHYGSPAVKSRLVVVDFASHYHGVDAVDRNVWLAAPFFHYPVMPYDDFMRIHPRFFLLASPASDWIPKRLHANGAEVELQSSPPDASLYLVTIR